MITARPARLAAVLVGVTALLLPALINGFPLMFHDSGAYLARAFDTELAPGRAPFYGYVIAAGLGQVTLWGVILLQASAILWLLALVLRQHGVDGPLPLAAVSVTLALVTPVAWVTATVMPDIFAPIAVLTWYLLVFGERPRPETLALSALMLVAALVHITHLALLLGLALCPGLWIALTLPERRRGLRRVVLIPLLALLLVPSVNGAVSGHFGFTPGGQTFIFARLLQSGLVARTLDDHCPSPQIRLCAYRDRLPATADEWIWDVDSPFASLGGFDGYKAEMAQIAMLSVSEHPWRNLQEAAKVALEQFVRVGIGEDIDAPYWHTDAEIARHLPQQWPALMAALQHQGRLGALTTALNRLYCPVTLAGLVAMIALLVSAHRALAGVIMISLLGNAVLCGVFSGPHDRYQGRIAWLAVFALLVTIAELWHISRSASARPADIAAI